MKDKNIIQLPDLDSNEEYYVGKKKKVKKPPFTLTGNNLKSLDIIADFNKPEAFTFKKLKEGRDWDSNTIEFATWYLSPTDKVTFSKGLKVLMGLDLVVRIKKGKPSLYMFNPDFIIPNEYDKAVIRWEELAG